MQAAEMNGDGTFGGVGQEVLGMAMRLPQVMETAR